MSDEELKAILADIRESIDTSATETRRYVDASVNASAAETRQYVDAVVSASAAETRTYVDASVNASAAETRQYVDAVVTASAAETRTYVDASVSASATETRRHIDVRVAELDDKFEITTEHLRGEIQLVAESVVALDEKFERKFTDLEDRMDRGFAETHALIKFGYGDLDRRVRVLENRS